MPKRSVRLIQLLIACDLAFLSASLSIGLARNVDQQTYDQLFGLTKWVTGRNTGAISGFAAQQATVGLLVAAVVYAGISWARSRRLSDRGLFLLAGAVAGVAPWLSIGLAAGAVPRTPGDFLICGTILVAILLSIRGLRLIDRKGWTHNMLAIGVGGTAIVLLWVSLVSLTSGFEQLVLWGSFIVSLLVAATATRWYLSAPRSVS